MIRMTRFFQGGTALALALGAAMLVPTSAQADPTPECNDGAEAESLECGAGSLSYSSSGTAVGGSATVSTNSILGTAVGAGASAGGSGSLALGGGASADDASQAGSWTTSDVDVSTAATSAGALSRVAGDGGVALGALAVVGVRGNGTVVNHGTSIGANSLVSAEGGSTLGHGATVAAGATNAVAIGSGSVADQANTVSLGTVGGERRVVNMADGVAATDGATVGQMAAADTIVLDSAKGYTDSRETAIRADIAAGGEQAIATANAYTDTRETAVRSDMVAGDAAALADARNYADTGDASTLSAANAHADMVGTRTLDLANSYTDSRFDILSENLERVRDRADAGVAAAIAGANIPQAFTPGGTMIGVGSGVWRGKAAFAVGASHLMANGKVTVRGSANFATRGGSGGGLGLGFSF